MGFPRSGEIIEFGNGTQNEYTMPLVCCPPELHSNEAIIIHRRMECICPSTIGPLSLSMEIQDVHNWERALKVASPRIDFKDE